MYSWRQVCDRARLHGWLVLTRKTYLEQSIFNDQLADRSIVSNYPFYVRVRRAKLFQTTYCCQARTTSGHAGDPGGDSGATPQMMSVRSQETTMSSDAERDVKSMIRFSDPRSDTLAARTRNDVWRLQKRYPSRPERWKAIRRFQNGR